jgi:hypothetical protein
MKNNDVRVTLFLLLFFFSSIATPLFAQDDVVDLVVRFGQGGFKESRSETNSLGGGQLALDIKPTAYPVALSVSSEYYKISQKATHPYEISNMICVNLLYMAKFSGYERVSYFAGGGFGILHVPKAEDDSSATRRGSLYDLEAGIRFHIYKGFGLYGAAKYLYAQKREDGVKVIDFSEGIVLLGLSYRFGF